MESWICVWILVFNEKNPVTWELLRIWIPNRFQFQVNEMLVKVSSFFLELIHFQIHKFSLNNWKKLKSYLKWCLQLYIRKCWWLKCVLKHWCSNGLFVLHEKRLISQKGLPFTYSTLSNFSLIFDIFQLIRFVEILKTGVFDRWFNRLLAEPFLQVKKLWGSIYRMRMMRKPFLAKFIKLCQSDYVCMYSCIVLVEEHFFLTKCSSFFITSPLNQSIFLAQYLSLIYLPLRTLTMWIIPRAPQETIAITLLADRAILVFFGADSCQEESTSSIAASTSVCLIHISSTVIEQHKYLPELQTLSK